MGYGKRATASRIYATRAQRLAASRIGRLRRRWQIGAVAGLVAIGGSFALPAHAAPTTCDSGFSISMNSNVVAPSNPQPTIQVARVGDTIDYRVILQVLSTQCALDNGTITVTHPNGVTQTLVTGVTATPGGAAQTFDENTVYPGQTPSYQAYVASDADVVANGTQGGVNATSSLSATGHQTDGSTFPDSGGTGRFVQVIHPETTLTKSATPTSGVTPLTSVYTFTEANTSNTGPDGPYSSNLANDAIDGTSVVIHDTGTGACSPLVPTMSGGFNVGDTNTNGLVDPAETWTFTCSNTYSTVGTFVNSATASGNAQDGREAGTSASSGAPHDEASESVTVTTRTPPPPPPGNIFEVVFVDCRFLAVAYNRFADGTVVNWNVTTNGVGTVASGSFTTIGGGKLGSKTYHFLTIPLGTTLPNEASGIQSHAHFHWGTNSSLAVTRDTDC